MQGVRRQLRRFVRDETGNATLEFIVIVPFLVYIIFMMAEIGVLMARTVMIDRGMDIAVRDLRLGLIPGATHDQIKEKVCEAAFLIGDCNTSLTLDVTPLRDLSLFPSGAYNCVDRTGDVEPVVQFDPGGRSEIVVIRACIVVDPVFPGTGIGAMLPKDASGGYQIVATSAFMNEPE